MFEAPAKPTDFSILDIISEIDDGRVRETNEENFLRGLSLACGVGLGDMSQSVKNTLLAPTPRGAPTPNSSRPPKSPYKQHDQTGGGIPP